jgi:hypothetical protein
MLQTDKDLNTSRFPFAETGCALMCIFYIAEQENAIRSDYESLIMLTEKLVEFQYVTPKLYINDWDGALWFLGVRLKYQGHINIEDKPIGKWEIGSFVNDKGWRHFKILWCRNKDSVIYDPDPSYNDWKLTDMRVFT